MARWGRMLAGLALMFIGLDLMQSSMAGMEGLVTPERLPGEGWVGRFLLMLIGVVLVAVIQSSSAGVALVLVLLGSGAVSFGQAAAMVIGMNIGTTLTGFLAALGGGREMLRAALANLLFNIGTAVLAFPLLDLIAPVLHGTAPGADDMTALALFHTGFNMLGTVVFLPLTPAFARLVIRLVPDRPVTLARALEPGLLSDPGTALDAAAQTAGAIAAEIGGALEQALAPRAARDLRPLGALPARVEPARAALERWLSALHIAPDGEAQMRRMAALMHLIDHLARLSARAREADRIAFLAENPRLARPARAVARALARGRDPARAERLADLVQAFAQSHRRSALLREHAGLIAPRDVFRETDALRWLDRVSEHADRISHHLAEAAGPGRGPARG